MSEELVLSLIGLSRESLVVIERACRFWAKVDLNGPEHPQLGRCWVWTANCLVDGYGQFEHYRAHRVVWELCVGPIPNKMHVLHECDNRPCVRPSHLRLGTALDNMQDAVIRGRGVGATKLTPDQVRSIRDRIKNHEVQRRIAEEYGLHPQTVSRIATRETWKGVV